ncbi:MAG TPA: MFS transporter [Ktedonobacterales bacterium]
MRAMTLASRRSPYAVFQSRAFRLLWVGQFISTAGSALSMLAASILVYRVTGSAFSVGLMLIVTALPSLLFGLIAGVIVDRFDRKRVMVIADLGRAGLVALVPALVLGTGRFHVPGGILWLYLLVMLAGVGTQFFEPAFECVLPDVASEEDLAAANALMQISSFGSTAIGFAGAGLIASRLPIAWAFYLDALSFLISAVCIGLAAIPRSATDEATSVRAVYQNLRAGAAYLFGSRTLSALFIALIPSALGIGLTNALLLPFATHALHASSFEYSLQEGITSVGFVAGSLWIATRADRIQSGQMATIGYLGLAVTTAIYAGLTSIWLAIAVMTISGAFNAPAAVARSLIVQRQTPREARGRVFSALFVARDLLMVVGMAAAGLADLVDVRALFLVGAGVLAASAAIFGLAPGLRLGAGEWRRLAAGLRAVSAAPKLGFGRIPAVADIDLLATLLPLDVGLSALQREILLTQGHIYETPASAAVIRRGETSTSAYFILSGRVVIGRPRGSSFTDTPVDILNPGDFFGEIAALTGSPRTANVVTDGPATLLETSAGTMRHLMRDPAFHRLLLSALTERLAALRMIDLPRYATLDAGLSAGLRVAAPDAVENEPVAAPLRTRESFHGPPMPS